jgi:hypothetical protein
MDERTLRDFGTRVSRVVRIGVDRYQLELPADSSPERLLGELSAAGVKLVSLNPIRATLEEIFVKRVATSDAVAGSRV